MSSRARAVAVAAAFLTVAPAVAAAQSATPPKGAPDGAIPVIVAPPETDKKARAATPVPASRLALAREVVIPQLPFDEFEDLLVTLLEASPDMQGSTPAQRAIIAQAVAEEFSERREQIIDLYALAYARVYTDAELAAWKAFLSSPEGLSVASKSGALALETGLVTQEMMQVILPGALRRALPRLEGTTAPTVPGQDS